jgi:hypothetical protein
MAQMPAFVQSALPVKCTKRGAISTDVLDSLIHDVLATSNFSAASSKIRQMGHERLHVTQQRFLQFCHHQKAQYMSSLPYSLSKQPYDSAAATASLSDPSALAMFNYNPSPKWLEEVFMASVEEPLQFVERHQGSLVGRFLCTDHTFKTAKYIKGPDNAKVYEAVLTVMNEHCQVVGQYMVQTKSWFEVQQALQLIWKRYEAVAPQYNLDTTELVSV